jgi:muramidase (phage lysozyme)
MEDRTFPYLTLPPAMDFAAPEALANADASPPGRKPRGAGACQPTLALTTLATGLFLLISLCGAKAALANSGPRVEKLRAAYALDESVEESDGRLIRRKLSELLLRREVRFFLKVIQTAEGGEPDLMVGGCRAPNLKQHPALVLPKSCQYIVSGWGPSTASGNYQITLTNWKKIAPFLRLRDFSETSQALAALELIRRGGGAAAAYTRDGLALKQRIQRGFLKLLWGDVDGALCLATYDWATSSCSTLPANNKIVYARLAGNIRKSEATRRRGRRGALAVRAQGAREKLKAAPKSSARTGQAGPARGKGSRATGLNVRVKD